MPPKSAADKLAEMKARHNVMQHELEEAQCEVDWEDADWAHEECEKCEKCDTKKHEEAAEEK